MKKILYVVALMVAVSFMSCGNGTTATGGSADSIDSVVDSTVVDSVAVVDSVK